jgi:hypothetical protein
MFLKKIFAVPTSFHLRISISIMVPGFKKKFQLFLNQICFEDIIMNIHKNRLSFLNPKSFIRENGGYHHRFLLYGHKHVRQKSSLSSQIKQKNQFFQDYPLSHGASKSQSLKSIELF